MHRRATAGQRSDRRRRIGLAVVRGESMLPTLAPGDRLLVSYGARVRVGDLVVAHFPDEVIVVKRATGERDGGWWLRGDNSEIGVDSRHRGAIPATAVAGVVRLRVWPRPRRL